MRNRRDNISTSIFIVSSVYCSFVSTKQFASLQVKVRDGSTDWGWGVVVNVVKKPPQSGTLPPALSASRGNNYIVDALLHCSSSSNENGSRSKPLPPRPGEKGEMHVVS